MALVADFRSDLSSLYGKQIIRKYLLTGPSHVLSEQQEFELKDKTSDHFDVEYSEVVLVGSGKLGFSIAPKKRYQDFGEESDIDVAVISASLFNKVWEEAYVYRESGAFWPKKTKFFEYLSRGWIRPDKLPSNDSFPFAQKWWSYYNSITSSQEYGPYKIRGGLYYSWFFFFQYQLQCVTQCQSELADENISN